MNAQILTVSSSGQISLPSSICERLSIDAGDKLVAYTTGDVIVLKTLKIPSSEEFELSLDEAQKWASSVGYTENDINDIIKSSRRKKEYENCGRYKCFNLGCVFRWIPQENSQLYC